MGKSIKKEWTVFVTALVYFTRLPFGKFIEYSKENTSRAIKYFPFVGVFVGFVSASVFMLAMQFFPKELAVALSMLSSVLFTGSLHEDGFSDSCDGFGGGWKKEQILRIMKDSSLGVYGAIGLIFILAIKFLTLKYIDYTVIPFMLFVAHTFSRFCSVFAVYIKDYARNDNTSKAGAIARSITTCGLIFSLIPPLITIAVSSYLLNTYRIVIIIIPVFIIALLMIAYFNKRIGGYTGDCLGAIQQITEVSLYLLFIANLNVVAFW